MSASTWLTLLAVIPWIGVAVEYGPSLSSLTGVFVDLRGSDLLTIQSGRVLQLELYPGFSVTIPLISGNSTATSDEIFKERGISTTGEFVVEAPIGFGIIATLQELRLRKFPVRKGFPNDITRCSDYIQIGDDNKEDQKAGTKDYYPAPEKTCGVVKRGDRGLKPRGLVGPRTFRSVSNRVKIIFNHAYVADLVEALLGATTQKSILKAELTLSAYRSCSDNGTSANFAVESCKEYSADSADEKVCISSLLFCDGVNNCGGVINSVGSDEKMERCPDAPAVEKLDGSNESLHEVQEVTLSALATYLGMATLPSYPSARNVKSAHVPNPNPSNPKISSTRRPNVLYGINSSSSLHPPTTKPTRGILDVSVLHSADEVSPHLTEADNDIYSRRELANAINSVIYGVAIFILFTVFITVSIVCITKKLQVSWNARQERRITHHDQTHQNSPERNNRPLRNGVVTLSPSIFFLPEHHPSSGRCQHGNFPTVTELEFYEEPPPAYESLFPVYEPPPP